MVFPVLLGEGKRLFPAGDGKAAEADRGQDGRQLGVVVLTYRRA